MIIPSFLSQMGLRFSWLGVVVESRLSKNLAQNLGLCKDKFENSNSTFSELDLDFVS